MTGTVNLIRQIGYYLRVAHLQHASSLRRKDVCIRRFSSMCASFEDSARYLLVVRTGRPLRASLF